MKIRTLLSVILLLSLFTNSFATHNHAGVITYKQISDYTIESSVITYTKLSPHQRDSIYLCWGDGTCEAVLRVNGLDNDGNGIPDGEVLDEYFQMNIYTTQHTYDEFGQYTLSMTDPNRNAGILNLNHPNSDMVPFHIQTEFMLNALSGDETNQSPVILEPPIIRAFVDLPYVYTPNAFDLDGDSIVYQITIPQQDINLQVPNYDTPCAIIGIPPDQSLCYLNHKKGLFYWDAPQVAGEYVVAILIKSFRSGELIDQMVLDFNVIVEDDPDIYPEIEIENISGNEIIPVNVGDTMKLEIAVSDPDINQEIEIASSSGLYDYFNNPATFEAVTNGNTGSATFEWIVMEEHFREQPYQVVIKAIDNDSTYSKTSLEVVCYQFEEFVTNVKNPEKQIDFQLFPNPVNEGFLNLKVESNHAFFRQYVIYNVSGQELKTGKISAGLTDIDVQFLESGIYFLKLEGDKNTLSKPFVVHKK